MSFDSWVSLFWCNRRTLGGLRVAGRPDAEVPGAQLDLVQGGLAAAGWIRCLPPFHVLRLCDHWPPPIAPARSAYPDCYLSGETPAKRHWLADRRDGALQKGWVADAALKKRDEEKNTKTGLVFWPEKSPRVSPNLCVISDEATNEGREGRDRSKGKQRFHILTGSSQVPHRFSHLSTVCLVPSIASDQRRGPPPNRSQVPSMPCTNTQRSSRHA